MQARGENAFTPPATAQGGHVCAGSALPVIVMIPSIVTSSAGAGGLPVLALPGRLAGAAGVLPTPCGLAVIRAKPPSQEQDRAKVPGQLQHKAAEDAFPG